MSDQSEPVVLPPGLAALWERREPGARGPKPGLDIDAIVAAAIAIANEDGLEAVSMAKVAKRLGFTPMSLYRYVASKDELLLLMWNASVDASEAAVMTGTGWRERLLSWAMCQRAAIQQNAWIVQMPMGLPPLAPNSLTWVELGLEALAGTGIPDDHKMRILGLISSHSLADARMAFDAERSVEEAAESGATVEYGRILRDLVDEDRWPHLHEVAFGDARLDDQPSPDDPFGEFRFDIELILDGVAARVDAARG